MKALVLTEKKQLPSIVELDYEKEGAVKVHLSHAALNHRDLYICQGLYPGIEVDKILGSDGCGTYEGNQYIINPNIKWGDSQAFQSSDYSVLGMPSHGTFAEYVWVEKNRLHPKPSHLSAAEAAAIPLGGLTAYRALMIQGEAKAGEKVLISGVGGGVAQFAMQFAIALGCKVIVTSSSQTKIDAAIKMGAIAGYNYTKDDWYKDVIADFSGVDVIIDSAGGDGFKNFIKISNPGARIAVYGGTRGKITEINTQLMFWRQIRIQGSTMGSDKDFDEMVEYINEHKIKPVIDKIFNFHDYKDAFMRMDAGSQFGKIILNIA